MKFNRELAMGFFIGFFGSQALIRTFATGDPYYIFNGIVGVGLALLFGIVGGINK